MSHEDYKIELFVFPDGTQVEMIVFDAGDAGRPHRPVRSRGAAAGVRPQADSRPAGALLRPRPAAARGPGRAPVPGLPQHAGLSDRLGPLRRRPAGR